MSGSRAICDEREDGHPEHHTQGAIGLVFGPLRALAQAGALPARFEGIVRRKRFSASEPSGFAGARRGGRHRSQRAGNPQEQQGSAKRRGRTGKDMI